MINVTLTNYNEIVCFWPIFVRLYAIIIHLPIFDHTSIPLTVKTLFALVLSYTFFPFLKDEVLKDLSLYGVDHFFPLTIFYACIGLMIGFMVKIILNIFIGSGSIINHQISFATMHIFDPSTATQIGPFEKLLHSTVSVMVIVSGGLIPMFKGIYLSFFSIGIHHFKKMHQSPFFFLEVFKDIFLSSLMLAGPLIFTNILITTILGILARTVPQMNIIMMNFVINIALGLFIFSATSHEFFHVAFQIYTEQLGKWFTFVT